MFSQLLLVVCLHSLTLMASWIGGPWETESADRTGRSTALRLCGLWLGLMPTAHPASDRSINKSVQQNGREEFESLGAGGPLFVLFFEGPFKKQVN